MKKTIKYLGSAALLTAAAMAVSSCATDDFFGEGEGTLRLRLMLNSNLTRAEVNSSDLSESCVVYISNSQGLIHKFQGLQNVPSSLPLKTGAYVAEAWAGDSVSASFDKKFYKTYQPFTITSGENNLVLNCRIANVVASIKPETINDELIKNWKITISNTRGSLEFTPENFASEHGYYMQPEGDTSLTWTMEAEDATNPGNMISASGVVENVQPAHEYIFNVRYGAADYNSVGGGFITIEVDDTALELNKDVMLYASPQIVGLGFNIDEPIIGEDGSFGDLYVGSSAYREISSFVVTFNDAMKSAFGLSFNSLDMKSAEAAFTQQLVNAGISWNGNVKGDFEYFNFNIPADVVNALSNGVYSIEISVTDGLGRTRQKTLNLEISDASIRTLPVEEGAVGSYVATLSASVLKDGASAYGIQFREQGTEEWTTLTSSLTRATTISFKLSGLKPATTYEWRAYADEFATAVQKFTTESAYVITNASMETWGLSSDHVANTVIPGTTRDYWDSGNHGSNKMGVTLTDKSTDMVHSGTYSAKLRSKFVGITSTIGKFAAGNIFIGEYAGTDGTDGILLLGRPFDGSHPIALEVYANYRPGAVTKTSSNSACPLVMGENDHGQIYVALVTERYEIRTKNQSRLFDENDSSVIAYGQVTWTDGFGPNGQLQKLQIPLNYKSGRENEKGAYLVVVASASKYGDYFAGGEGSTMYLDDFRMVYEGE